MAQTEHAKQANLKRERELQKELAGAGDALSQRERSFLHESLEQQEQDLSKARTKLAEYAKYLLSPIVT